jgi:hypothetical protein
MDGNEDVFVRRQWSHNHRIGVVPFSGLKSLQWTRMSGGVNAMAPQRFLSCIVLCTDVEGDIAHSCRHGPPPHPIRVFILKKDNPKLYAKLIEIAGSKPKQ